MLWALPTGLFVVGSRAGDDRNLMTCNWVMQVATSPKLVAVAVESGSVTRDLIDRGGSFSVCLLARSERSLVRRFVKPARDVETDGDGVATSIQGEPVVEVGDGLPCLRRVGGVAGLLGALGGHLGRNWAWKTDRWTGPGRGPGQPRAGGRRGGATPGRRSGWAPPARTTPSCRWPTPA